MSLVYVLPRELLWRRPDPARDRGFGDLWWLRPDLVRDSFFGAVLRHGAAFRVDI